METMNTYSIACSSLHVVTATAVPMQGGTGTTAAGSRLNVPTRLSRAVRSNSSHIPRSAMNPDFEYALPPQLGLLRASRCSYAEYTHTHPPSTSMPLSLRVGAPVTCGHALHLHTTFEGTSSHAPANAHANTGGRRTGLLAQTEVQRLLGSDHHACAYGGPSVPGSHCATAPLPGAASLGWPQESLLPVTSAAERDTVEGGTVVLSPLTHHEQNLHAYCHSTGIGTATAGGARFSSADTMSSTASGYSGRSLGTAGSGLDTASAVEGIQRGDPARGAITGPDAGNAKLGCPRGVWAGVSSGIGGTPAAGLASRGGDAHGRGGPQVGGGPFAHKGLNTEPPVLSTRRHLAAQDASGWHGELQWERRMRRLQRQLDAFGEEDLFLGRFELLGRDWRRRGGAARKHVHMHV